MSAPEIPRLSWPQRLIVTVVLVLLAVWIGLAGAERLSARFDPEPARAVPPPAVETLVVSEETAVVERVYRGSVESEGRARISARLTAQILQIPHREGALVRRGDVLARLDDEEIRRDAARLEAVADRLEGERATARREAARQEDLFRRNLTPERSLDDARQRVSTLEAQIRENAAALGLVQRRLTYAEERAPFDAQVQRVHASEGELAAAGQPLVELVALSSLKAVVQVPQVDARRLRPGMTVRLEVPALSRIWPARVDRVYPALDAGSRNATFAAFFPEDADGVRPGMAVQAHIALDHIEGAVRLPAQAVLGEGPERRVYVLEDGRARERLVQVAVARAGEYLITAGLEAGEQVIVTADPRLGDGLPVQAGEHPHR
ncbi:efflux transporter, RND family, MFP subunit [Thioalkalivibrio sulfidiphilus HL-EbGr7]|uniref:Efflux transporter, RND family, MFP subunit n=1 Tax=Thioalkalivibrio sulfidiphilus (strain HL-EbGR7) TaxID=396588 RepID=B8GUP1_THISH|nr:efflux RND transporter periplasmic adaptor subunit [Thioalkalivibrio sulfidiphilus]ACL71402.1 efflux transporter, RND family, MFP subunit [Thioalkalivibrio sulfidiphilus HL-EbGr7]